MDFTAEDILIPADHPCFEGHFPGHPVFPAVAQMDLILDHLLPRWNQNAVLVSIHKAKYPAPIAPGASVSIALRIEDDKVYWRIFGKEKTYSQGMLQFQLPDP